jgi:hypothetical protein
MKFSRRASLVWSVQTPTSNRVEIAVTIPQAKNVVLTQPLLEKMHAVLASNNVPKVVSRKIRAVPTRNAATVPVSLEKTAVLHRRRVVWVSLLNLSS